MQLGCLSGILGSRCRSGLVRKRADKLADGGDVRCRDWIAAGIGLQHVVDRRNARVNARCGDGLALVGLVDHRGRLQPRSDVSVCLGAGYASDLRGERYSPRGERGGLRWSEGGASCEQYANNGECGFEFHCAFWLVVI